MPTVAEIRQSLRAAWQLMLFRSDGFRLLARDEGAVWRSFFAMVLATPAFLLQIELLRDVLGMEAPGLHFYAIWGLTYVCLWFAFPLILVVLGERQRFSPNVPFYVMSSNWVALIGSYLKLVPTLLLGGQGDLNDLADAIFLCWMLANDWWLMRRILQVNGGQAAALVLLSQLVGYALFFFALSRTALLALLGAA